MKPEELLSNFLVYNTPILNEIKNESKELSDAVNSVVTELFGKFILPQNEQNEKIVPKPVYKIFDIVLFEDDGKIRTGGVTKISWSATKSTHVYALIVQSDSDFYFPQRSINCPKNVLTAINKYTPQVCSNYFIQREESGTKTIAEENTFEGKNLTTRQAQAAINAGEWLFINAYIGFKDKSTNPLAEQMQSNNNAILRGQKKFWGQASTVYRVNEKDIKILSSTANSPIEETPKETPKEKTKWSEMSTQELKEELDANLEIIDIFDEDDPEAIKAADQNIEIEIELDNRN
jgi:hypothetical protein